MDEESKALIKDFQIRSTDVYMSLKAACELAQIEPKYLLGGLHMMVVHYRTVLTKRLRQVGTPNPEKAVAVLERVITSSLKVVPIVPTMGPTQNGVGEA